MLQKLFVEYAFGPVPPTKVEANALKPRTTLVLHLPHQLGDRDPVGNRARLSHVASHLEGCAEMRQDKVSESPGTQ
jgi:hypothetical protein